MLFIFTVVIETMTIIFNSIPRLLRNHERNLMPAIGTDNFRRQIRAIEEEVGKLQDRQYGVCSRKQREFPA